MPQGSTQLGFKVRFRFVLLGSGLLRLLKRSRGQVPCGRESPMHEGFYAGYITRILTYSLCNVQDVTCSLYDPES